MGAEEALAKALGVYLDDGEGESPQERSDRRNALGEPVAWLLQELMNGQPGWDPRFSWLDGMAVLSVRRTAPDALRVTGGAFVSDGDRTALRPVEAELKRPPAESVLYFASPEAEADFVRGQEGRLVVPPDPSTWPYRFEVTLP